MNTNKLTEYLDRTLDHIETLATPEELNLLTLHFNPKKAAEGILLTCALCVKAGIPYQETAKIIHQAMIAVNVEKLSKGVVH